MTHTGHVSFALFSLAEIKTMHYFAGQTFIFQLRACALCTVYMYVKVHAIHYWVVFHNHNCYDLSLKHAINSCPIVLLPCRMIVLMGVVTIFNSVFVASDFAVMVVSTENYKYLCPKYFNG